MLLSTFSKRIAAGSIPLTLVALGLSGPALAKEGNPLKMPRTYAAAEKITAQAPANPADLGVMGEVELVRERYADGAIKVERQVTLDRDGNYVNHGAWKLYSTSGDVLAEGQFHFGERAGLWTRWHGRNGSSVFADAPFNQFKAPYMSQATFNEGVMDGEWLITDANDKKVCQISLRNGQRHGVAITWLPNGKTYRQASYEHGKQVGELLEANQKGELQRAATYEDGRKIVTRTNYYPAKKQKMNESIYLSAATVQQSQDDFWNVRLAKYSTQGQELRHGTAKAWFADGKQEYEGFYQNGQKSGTFTFWHENGQLAASGEYRSDEPIGQWVWWHANGQKSAIGQYQNGILIGEWRWWDETGKLTEQRVYDGSESVTTSEDEDSFKVSAVPEDEECL